MKGSGVLVAKHIIRRGFAASSFYILKISWRKPRRNGIDLGSKYLAISVSSEWRGLFLGGTNLINVYSTDRLKLGLMYNNSSKKYREYLSKNRGISKLWSLSNAAGLMGLFFEGAGY